MEPVSFMQAIAEGHSTKDKSRESESPNPKHMLDNDSQKHSEQRLMPPPPPDVIRVHTAIDVEADPGRDSVARII